MPPEIEDTFCVDVCLSNPNKSLVIILKDGESLDLRLHILRFFDNNHDIFTFPAWDFQPHKGMSPSSHVMSARVRCLQNLLSASKPYVLITTVGAITQKVLPRSVVPSMTMNIKPGQTLSMDALIGYLVEHGYSQCASVVQEVGSFAVRGEIVDIFQSADEDPIRIYFCYDTIESIKFFQITTQLTVGEALEDLLILPVSEVIKNDGNIQSFKARAAQLAETHPALYEAVISRQKYPGEEQLLPCFVESLETIFDYVKGAVLVFSEAVAHNLPLYIEKIIEESVADFSTSLPRISMDLADYLEASRPFAKIVAYHFEPLDKSIVERARSTKKRRGLFTAIPNFRLQAKERNSTIFAAAADYMAKTTKPVILACYCRESLQYLVEKFKSFDISMSPVHSYSDVRSGYSIAIAPMQNGVETQNFILITEHSLLGREYSVRKPKATIASNASDLTIGDVVVHRDYGVGIFNALKTLTVCGNCHDFVEISYRNDDKLFVPVEDTDLITKYGNNTDVILDKLGSTSWQEKKAKLKKRIRDIAKALLSSEAMRRLSEGSKFFASTAYRDFCKECAYVETEDQLKAIADVENDLSSGKVMDRLICGDVGFGKTEIALRAAFLVVSEDITCQVAVIVPTTLLCNQHFGAFKDRFKNYDVNIQQLSKVTARKKQQIKRDLEEGNINIIIGTSALLTDDVRFLDLRLLIIDEEQHFGVQQKEKMRLFKSKVHVLSLSATPIPRTLHMSLSGIKDLSILRTPPIGRLAVEISISHYNNKAIKEAILKEISRGGRIFFTCPLISDIAPVMEKLKQLVPEVKIAVAHGKTAASTLDKIMNEFYEGKFSLLLTTSIIESGIDVPIANTIIVYNADMFGLAQLYQLKGRVGRSTTQGYAYFLLSNKAVPNSPGVRRLEILKSLNSIGSGFSLSLQDMDMRGFGNLVGEEQSGNIKEIGTELYYKMLSEEMEACKSATEDIRSCHDVKVDININVRIPPAYIRDLDLRMNVYKKVSGLKTPTEIERCAAELTDRFGKPPREVENLLDVLHIKHLCSIIRISEVTQMKNSVTLQFQRSLGPKEERLLEYFVRNMGIFTITGNNVKMTVPGVHAPSITKYVISQLSTMCGLLSESNVCSQNTNQVC